MKQTLLFIVIALLTSCDYTAYEVKLNNGAVIKVSDEYDRSFKTGDTVCIKAPIGITGKWSIQNDGTMTDTMYTSIHYRKSQNDSVTIIHEYRIGIIK